MPPPEVPLSSRAPATGRSSMSPKCSKSTSSGRKRKADSTEVMRSRSPTPDIRAPVPEFTRQMSEKEGSSSRTLMPERQRRIDNFGTGWPRE